MNSAAQELGREPILATARAMIPAGQPIPDAINPELLLTAADRLKGA